MEKVYLILEGDTVIDAQVWDDGNLPEGVDMIEHGDGVIAWLGWTRVAGELVAPPAPPAVSIDTLDPAPIAALLALLQAQGTAP